MNRRWVWIHRALVAVLGLLIVALITVVGGVAFFYWSIRGPAPVDVTPQEARQRVASLVEETIAYAAPGRTGDLEDPEGSGTVCWRYLAMTDDSYLQFEWEIDDVDAALADQIIARVVGLWSERGYGPEVDNGPEEGVTTVSSREDEDGFGYSLLANKNQRKVWVHGYTHA